MRRRTLQQVFAATSRLVLPFVVGRQVEHLEASLHDHAGSAMLVVLSSRVVGAFLVLMAPPGAGLS